MHLIVLLHNAKNDPEPMYFGSMAQAVSSIEAGTQLFGVLGFTWNGEYIDEEGHLCPRLEPEDASEDFLAAWTARRIQFLTSDFWTGEAQYEYGKTQRGLDRYIEHELNAPYLIAPAGEMKVSRGFSHQVAAE